VKYYNITQKMNVLKIQFGPCTYHNVRNETELYSLMLCILLTKMHYTLKCWWELFKFIVYWQFF